ncbi:MAG: type II secretion system protein GspG [Puniceicoccales bacterium]|jgi:type II secretory pathway pseudopilin PulG|nr:type II secretion system protein GspG [Puniceicoccales bacterium]
MCHNQESSRGFTLLEISASVIIIMICIVLFKVVYNYRESSIKSNVTHEELALLNCAVEIFKSENGFYPVCDLKSVDMNARELYGKISAKVESFESNHKWNISDSRIIDPWGNPYVYMCTSKDAISYVLFSMGPNGTVDANELIDDIHSR